LPTTRWATTERRTFSTLLGLEVVAVKDHEGLADLRVRRGRDVIGVGPEGHTGDDIGDARWHRELEAATGGLDTGEHIPHRSSRRGDVRQVVAPRQRRADASGGGQVLAGGGGQRDV
jgi:hypothetical protein